jgi:hypothetical protein
MPQKNPRSTTGRKRWQMRHQADWLASAMLVIFFALFFFSGLFQGYFYLAGDPLAYLWPMRTVAWEMIRQGTIPLWTPTIFSGYPLLSMSHLGLGYPLTWGYLVLPGHYAEQIYQLAPYLLSSFFTFYYVRCLGHSATAALLAALSFSYGGLMVSLVGSYGFLPNGGMWLPLMLAGIERTRQSRLLSGMLLATLAYTMSVLSGVGQSFVMVAVLAVCYAAFLSVAVPAHQQSWKDRRRWYPLLATSGAMALSAGIAAFQILETLPAARLSVRPRLSYEVFTEGSFPFQLLLKSFFEPLHNSADSTPYVPPLALVMAMMVVAGLLRRRARDRRVIFWMMVAAISFVLMMGAFTPLYRLVWHIPFLNRFRVPSRHSYEWTFALSVLAAYGWDAAGLFWKRMRQQMLLQKPLLMISASAVLLSAGAVISALWWREMCAFLPQPCLSFGELHRAYLGWKLLFFVLIVMALWCAWQISLVRWRQVVMVLLIALACFIEPFMQISHLSAPLSFTADRFYRLSETTRFLQQFPPEQHRIYSQVNSSELHSPFLRIDPSNLTAPAGLQNVAGYEPLLLERYSRALNSNQWNEVNRTPFLRQDLSLFASSSHVLDLLNATHAVAYSGLRMEPQRLRLTSGIGFAESDLATEIKMNSPVVLSAENQMADTIALVTTMANSVSLPDETVMASITIHLSDGRTLIRELRAGRDTAEWAHERPDVRFGIRHRMAEIFDRRAGNESHSFSALRYLARIGLGEKVRVSRVEIRKVAAQPALMLWKASVFDSQTGASASMTTGAMSVEALDRSRWETVYEKDGAMILRNHRALPRAWLVAEAEAVTDREAWARIRGHSAVAFDPRRTALLEVPANRLPALPGGIISANDYVTMTRSQANSMEFESVTEKAALLVISEINYPGWVAMIDGQPAEIFQTDYLLRSVLLPPGKHQIEMYYAAPQARRGAYLSLASVLVTLSLAFVSFLRKTPFL